MKNILLSAFLLMPIISFSQQIEIDLSEPKINERKNVSTGTKEIVLMNALFDRKYEVSYTISDLLPDPIKLEASKVAANSVSAGGNPDILDDAVKCPGGSGIRDAISNVNQAISEAGLKENYKLVRDKISGLPADCKILAEGLLSAKERDIKKSTFIKDLKFNQVVHVTVTRMKGEVVEKIWEFDIRTQGKVDKWLIHYGFTYQPGLINRHSQYFSKATDGGTGGYEIARMSGNPEKAWQNISPTLVFSHPLSRSYREIMPAISIITGTNFSTYSAGIGFSSIVAYNGLISIGLMYSEKYALNGKYKEGDVIKENLNFEQLHSKRGGIEVFITVALRLDKNPFSSSDSKKGE